MYRPRNHQQRFAAHRNQFFPRGRGQQYGQFNGWRAPAPGPGLNHNEEHWCETCDRGFHTTELLDHHKQQHQKCNIDGCQFIAHPKVITKHIQMQHSTGLFKKIGNLSNPEDVQKWREERKKKYPTKENVDKKNAAVKEKIERGEKMGLKFNKAGKGQNAPEASVSGDVHKRKYPFENKPNHDFKKKNTLNHIKKKMPPKRENNLPSADDSRKLKPFSGFQYLMLEEINSNESADIPCNSMIEDDDDITGELTTDATSIKPSQPSVCGALSTLMCDYGSTDDECDDNIVPHPNPVEYNTHNLHKSTSNKKLTVTENNKAEMDTITENKIKDRSDDNCKQDDDSGPEEIKVEKSVKNQSNIDQPLNFKDNAKNYNKIKNNVQNRKNPRKPKTKLPSTLLEKLLHREIKQERNIVLQCVRHIVKNNFFDK